MGMLELRSRMANLTPERRKAIAKFQAHRFRRLQYLVYRTLIGSNLRRLAVVNNSDKWGGHRYAQHYERHFAPLRRKRLKLLEIGIGGYDDPEMGGGSLRMWRTYFPRAQVYGLDICDKSAHDERRIKTFRGSQVDLEFLDSVLKQTGPLDIIIDDGSHLNEHVIQTFRHLFPRLASPGFYVIEDTQTSYWENWGGSSTERDGPGTSMGFIKGLIDGLNYIEFPQEGYEPTYYDRNIVAMHFYHNLVFIEKGDNNEPVSPNRPTAEQLQAVAAVAKNGDGTLTPDHTPVPPTDGIG